MSKDKEQSEVQESSRIYCSSHDELIKFRWKTEICNQGDRCWCRIITTETPVYWSPSINNGCNDEEMYIAPSGAIPVKIVEHIVDLHNKNLEDDAI